MKSRTRCPEERTIGKVVKSAGVTSVQPKDKRDSLEFSPTNSWEDIYIFYTAAYYSLTTWETMATAPASMLTTEEKDLQLIWTTQNLRTTRCFRNDENHAIWSGVLGPQRLKANSVRLWRCQRFFHLLNVRWCRLFGFDFIVQLGESWCAWWN